MRKLLTTGVSALALSIAGSALAQTAEQETAAAAQATTLDEIVVTAQKREQSLNDVPVTVNAATAEQLSDRGISQVSDLAKLVPGFTFTESAFNTPVFTLRGVGFYDTSMAAKPGVSLYVDEVPLPFSVITHGASLDVQRVEVLKGPQGTLFGQNSTGGAINYIAAKPTDDFQFGYDAGVNNFGQVSAGGYVSGPLSDTLGARLSFHTEQGGAWQKSLTRPGDELGDKDFTAARLLVDFSPTDRLRFELNLNGYIDQGDNQAAQYIALTPLANPARAGLIDAAPRALNGDTRQADWTSNPRPRRDDTFYQASLRAEYDVTDNMTLTSITAYSDYEADDNIDPDGVALNNYFYRTVGSLESFSQELRLGGTLGDRVNFILGANYSKEETSQRENLGWNETPSAFQIVDALAPAGIVVPPFYTFFNENAQTFENQAVFANVDYDLTDMITLHGGVRYTQADIDFNGCTGDTGDDGLATGIEALLNLIRGGVGLPLLQIAPGSCTSTNAATLSPGRRFDSLNQENTSWRVGADFKPDSDTLLYVSASKGFKSGGFPVLAGSDLSQFDPVVQESVLAYELGFKQTLFENRVQLNGALFYYEYENKQLKGRGLGNPNIFGPLEKLFNVPESSIRGAEIQIDARPIEGLTASLGFTYLDSQVDGDFFNMDSYGTPQNFSGSPFPYTPKYQGVFDVQYEWPVSGSYDGFVGAGAIYQSETAATLGSQTSYPYPELNALGGLTIDSYTLVDFRAGIQTSDQRYKLSVYVRNAFDEYYWTNATRITDTTVRFAGMPRTFGLTLAAKF
ncbi:TonB-dependent receptor [soil metagenome]